GWAPTIAERVWGLTGRMASQDTNMEANFDGGNYYLRRLFNMRQWITKGSGRHLRPFVDLFYPEDHPERWVDFDEGDFFKKNFIPSMYDKAREQYKVDHDYRFLSDEEKELLSPGARAIED